MDMKSGQPVKAGRERKELRWGETTFADDREAQAEAILYLDSLYEKYVALGYLPPRE